MDSPLECPFPRFVLIDKIPLSVASYLVNLLVSEYVTVSTSDNSISENSFMASVKMKMGHYQSITFSNHFKTMWRDQVHEKTLTFMQMCGQLVIRSYLEMSIFSSVVAVISFWIEIIKTIYYTRCIALQNKYKYNWILFQVCRNKQRWYCILRFLTKNDRFWRKTSD